MSHEQDAVADRQQQLVAMIYGLQKANPRYSSGFARGLEVYQNNLRATASRALSTSYPVIHQLLGEEAMSALARMLMQTERPATGDWADWGGGLKTLLINTPLNDEHPYLFDMAELEWGLHQASRAAHRPLQQESLSRLSDTPIENIGFTLADSVWLMASDYPVDIIWQAHQQISEHQPLDTERLAHDLQQQPGGCQLVIHRLGNAPRIQRISEEEFAWLSDIQAGNSLGAVLDQYPQFDFTHWLSSSLENQWIEQLVKIN